ncbi:MAG: hypothetical protein RLY61_604 [Candidatus Parcubacteria bacterium]|jgi:hypothetical protein
MLDTPINKARDLIKTKPYLAWSTKNYDELTPQSILESIIGYGDWADFISFTEIFGMIQSARLFEEIKNKPRSNLRIQTVNYFTKYFAKHA